MDSSYRFLRSFALISIATVLVACSDDDDPKNVAPTASAGTSQTVDEQTAVTLTGSGTDTDGTIASYAWVQTSGTDVTLQNADAASASFTAPDISTDENLVFELTVTDNDGASDSDSATVAVVANLPPTADAGVNQTANEQTAVTLTGTGTDTDGTIASYAWVQTSGTSVTLQNADTASASFTGPDISADESLVFELTVTDNDGDSAVDSTAVAIVADEALVGVVADGYLVGADVCLDTDGDNSCVGEATLTQTGVDGKFTIEASEEDLAKYPVVSEVVEGVTTDTDRVTADNPTGVIPDGEGYTLSSPPGVVDANGDPFVSPLTTLAENERQRILKDDPDTVDATAAALVSVAEKLGISTEDAETALTADYVADAQSSDPAVAKKAEQLHVVAQVTTKLLADAKAEIETAINTGNLSNADSADAILAALDRVSEQLDEVNAQVEVLLATLESQSFATDEERKVALDEGINTTTNANDVVDAGTIADIVEVDNAPTDTLTAAAMLQLDGGVWLTFLETDYNSDTGREEAVIYVDNIAYITETDTSIDDFYVFNPDTAGIDLDEDSGDSTFVALTDKGWIEVSEEDEHYTWQLNEDGSVLGSSSNESVLLSAAVTEVNLSGQSVAAVMALYKFGDDLYWPNILPDDAVFMDGAIGYVFGGEDSPQYKIFGLPENSVQLVTGVDELTSLNQLVSPVDISIEEFGVNDDAAYFQVGDNGGNAGTINKLIIVFAHLFDGVVTYFTLDVETGSYSSLATATYNTATVNGEDILQLDYPAALNSYRIADGEGTKLSFSIYDGLVRNIDADDAETFNELAFNEAARDDVLAAVDTGLLRFAAELPDNLNVFAGLGIQAFPDREGTSYIAAFFEGQWFIIEQEIIANRSTITFDLWSVDSAPILGQFFIQTSSEILDLGPFLAAGQRESYIIIDAAGNILQGPIPQLQPLNISYLSAVDGSGDTAIYTTCNKTGSAINNGEFTCTDEDGLGYFSVDKTTILALVAELNTAALRPLLEPVATIDFPELEEYFIVTNPANNEDGMSFFISVTVDSEGNSVADVLLPTSLTNFPVELINRRLSTEFIINNKIKVGYTYSGETLTLDGQTVGSPIQALDELRLSYVTSVDTSGSHDVYSFCALLVDDVASGETDCGDNDSYLSTDKATMEAIYTELNSMEVVPATFGVTFDQSKFIGNTVYDVYDDNDSGAGGPSDWHVDRLTFNANGSLGIDAENPVSNVNIQYEFLNDSSVIHLFGTLTEDGNMETVSTFIVAVAYYEADDVYGACWQDERDDGVVVTTADEAIQECAGSNGFEDPLLFDETQAEAIAAAEGFTPSE